MAGLCRRSPKQRSGPEWQGACLVAPGRRQRASRVIVWATVAGRGHVKCGRGLGHYGGDVIGMPP